MKKFCSFSSICIVLSINILQAGKRATPEAETMQRREAKGLVGIGQVNLVYFVESLAYPHLKKKAEDMDGSYAIHLKSLVLLFSFSAFHGV